MQDQKKFVTRRPLPGWVRGLMIVAGALATLYVLAVIVVLYALSTGDWG